MRMLLIDNRGIVDGEEMRLNRPMIAYSGRRISPIVMNDKR